MKSFKQHISEMNYKVMEQDSIPHSIHKVWSAFYDAANNRSRNNAFATVFMELKKADQMKIVINYIFNDLENAAEGGKWLADNTDLAFGIVRGKKDHKDEFNLFDDNGELLSMPEKEKKWKSAEKHAKKLIKRADKLEKSGEINGMTDMIKMFT